MKSPSLPSPRPPAPAFEKPDPRLRTLGRPIPAENYCDQPFVVLTGDGAWLCCMTTGRQQEGERGQHVVTMRSTDHGATWETPVDVEPADGPEASYAVMLVVPSGRVYIFYNHNSDDVRSLPWKRDDGTEAVYQRVDTLGHFVFKYSDDHGRTWSKARHDIPMRVFECDRTNYHGGKILYFWNVGRPFVWKGEAMVPLTKVGSFGRAFMDHTEGVLLASPNLLTEMDVTRIRWETLPEGDRGLRTPPGGGTIAEEQSYQVLSDDSIRAVYRTTDGFPAESYSRDGGRTWSTPAWVRFGSGRVMKHPRAANFAWKCGNGKYLYWFHHHGGAVLGRDVDRSVKGYQGRNPVWLCGGVEVDGPQGRVIRWSEPEIALYEDIPSIRMSYPDLIEEDGVFWVTETQKAEARVHLLDGALLEGLWRAAEGRGDGSDALRSEAATVFSKPAIGAAMPFPKIEPFGRPDHQHSFDHRLQTTRTGFSLELTLKWSETESGNLLFDTRSESNRGLCLSVTKFGELDFFMGDGMTGHRMVTEPCLAKDKATHVVLVVDGGPRVVTVVVNGHVLDGGETMDYGWSRFSPYLADANGGAEIRFGSGVITGDFRLYGRALKHFEAGILSRGVVL